MEPYKYDGIIVVKASDLERVKSLLFTLKRNMPVERLVFISSDEALDVLESVGYQNAGFVNENDLLRFADVERIIKKILRTEAVPRGIVGWYYQQFLKMSYACICEDEYYLSWDGDTLPCKKFSMFSADNKTPCFDLKHEYCEEYFITMGKIIPGMHKVIEKSFISEHMLFNVNIMKNLIKTIEANNNLPGEKFYEKILYSINPEKIRYSSFSEFETYGTYVALTNPSAYRLRDWHSMRFGSFFFKPNEMDDAELAWLSKDFDAVSFEKDDMLITEYYELFHNEKYVNNLSARQILEAIQEEAYEYANVKEVWD